MLTQDLSQFGLTFEFMTNEKICKFFRHKTVANIPSLIEGLNSFMNVLETHGHKCEKHFFASKSGDPYAYSGDCSNLFSQVLIFLAQNTEKVSESDFETLIKLFEIFSSRCKSIKILLNLVEIIDLYDGCKLTPVKDVLNNRVKYLTEHKNDVNQQIATKKISKKNMSIGKL
jgi:hypothetical protein